MLSVRNIKKSYLGELVLKDLSFDVKSGEIFGMLGPNGSGKTTTLSIIVGLLNPNEGNVEILGLDSVHDSKQYKNKIGFVSDGLNLYDYLTGREYVHFLGSLRGIPKRDLEMSIKNLSIRFEMDGKINYLIKTYSKGMRQKIALMGALIHKPKLLVLDEPFNGLDPKSIKTIKDYFKAYVKDGNSIIFSTHILEIAEKLCDRLLIINRGNLLALDTLDNLNETISDANQENLEDTFHKLTENLVN